MPKPDFKFYRVASIILLGLPWLWSQVHHWSTFNPSVCIQPETSSSLLISIVVPRSLNPTTDNHFGWPTCTEITHPKKRFSLFSGMLCVGQCMESSGASLILLNTWSPPKLLLTTELNPSLFYFITPSGTQFDPFSFGICDVILWSPPLISFAHLMGTMEVLFTSI